MAQRKEPAIVAELGRPETAEETAQRKAENSRKHRANQTLVNLLLAVGASLAIVIVLVAVVVRPDPAPAPAIDYAAVAEQAEEGHGDIQLLAPRLPEGWKANDARFGPVAEVQTWYVGFITPTTQFIALNQGIDANRTWQATVLDGANETGSLTLEGITWKVYDQRDVKDPGNHAYALSTTTSEGTLVLHGTASDVEFETLAASISAELE